MYINHHFYYIVQKKLLTAFQSLPVGTTKNELSSNVKTDAIFVLVCLCGKHLPHDACLSRRAAWFTRSELSLWNALTWLVRFDYAIFAWLGLRNVPVISVLAHTVSTNTAQWTGTAKAEEDALPKVTDCINISIIMTLMGAVTSIFPNQFKALQGWLSFEACCQRVLLSVQITTLLFTFTVHNCVHLSFCHYTNTINENFEILKEQVNGP